jgi:pSer/pThr/pTyr-binding forkhead associated (FHA) protein
MEDEAFKIPEFPIGSKKPNEVELKTSSKEQQESYKEPSWSEKSVLDYGFEVLKNGVIVQEIKDLNTRAFWMIGRLQTSDIDIVSLHPTTSRHHAVLQYRPPAGANDSEDSNNEQKVEPGWFIYDLGMF